jgi:hypothetical protein
MQPFPPFRRATILVAAWIAASLVLAQQPLVIKPLAQKKVSELPSGELFWRIENFGSRKEANAAAGPWSLVIESVGKVWLFTLGPAGRSSANGTKVAEIGPIQRINAKEYLLRISDAIGAPGSMSPVHSHPGWEACLVLTGEQSFNGPHGVMRVRAGEASQSAGTAMQVSSSGSTDLRALVMFVVDASKPFSSPASLP